MCVECYYPSIPPRREWKYPEKHLIGYHFYDGYVVQELNGKKIFETTTMWFVKRKIKKLENQGFIIYEVR